MAAAVVVAGRPVDLERTEFTRTKGDKAGEVVESLRFRLSHPATSMGFPIACEARGEELIKQIEQKAASGDYAEFVAQVYTVRTTKEDGKDWAKLDVRAVIQ